MKKVTCIILNYNTSELLKKCINNLEGQYTNLKLIVVDNASPDDSVEMVETTFLNENYPWITLIKTDNKGLSHGYNLALAAADKDTDYFLFLGTDAFPEDPTIKGMVSWMNAHVNTGISTPKLIQKNSKIDLDAHRGFPTPWVAISHFLYLDRIFPKSKLFNGYFMGWEDMDVPHNIDLCISHFMLIRKEVFEKIGTWDEDYWLYGEDVDLCWRTKEGGFSIMYLPMWLAVHYKGATVGVRKMTIDITKASFEDKYNSHRASTESMRKFYEKNWQERYPKFLTSFIFLAIDLLGKYRLMKFKSTNPQAPPN